MQQKRAEGSEPKATSLMDLRGKPTRECLCGCPIMKVRCKFDAEGNIAMWFVDAECADCGALLTAPTPVDED